MVTMTHTEIILYTIQTEKIIICNALEHFELNFVLYVANIIYSTYNYKVSYTLQISIIEG